MSLLKYVFLFSFLVVSATASGQAARSPFSTFGIGEPYGNALINNQGMGGVGVSQPQFWFVNNQNPALLVFNYYTSFQAGTLLESRTVRNDTTNLRSVNGNLSYLVTALPVKPGKWTTSVGLMPFTSVNYRLEYLDFVQNSDPQDTLVVVEQGSGGLSQVYWANGVRLHDDWSVGLRATYLFGSINNDYSNTLVTTNQLPRYTISVTEQTFVKDFQFTVGLSFSKDSLGNRQDTRFNAGATYTFGTNLKANNTTVFQRRDLGSTPITSDTIYTNRGRIFLPATFTAGISISKSTKWAVGTEFSIQDWAQFSSINPEDTENLEKAWKLAFGGEVTPDQLSDNFLKRVTYRAGAYYENAPFLINNNALRDFGINFGFSLPTGRSSLDIAFSTGKRGNRSKNVLEETYFRVYFGLTFNDQWFIRRKFD
jgi:hypothetical protein